MLETLKNRQELPQTDKEHLKKKPTANITLNDERWAAFLLKSVKKTRLYLSPLLLSIVLLLASTVKQEKDIEIVQTEKEEVKLSSFTDSLICR